MSDSYLQALVIGKCQALGPEAAASFFAVSESLVRQWLAGSKTPSLAAVERVFQVPDQKSVEAAWEGKKVMMLLPWYKTTNPLTAFSLFGLLDKAKMGVSMEYGDAFVAHARDMTVQRFRTTGIEWALFADDDMIFPFGNAQWFRDKTRSNLADEFAGTHTLNRLLSHNLKLVGGLYYGRGPQGKAMYWEAIQEGEEGRRENIRAHTPRNEVKPVTSVATGCLLVHRDVFTDIEKAFPNLAPQHPSEPWHFFERADDAIVTKFEEIKNASETVYAEIVAGTCSLERVGKFLKNVSQQAKEAQEDVFKNNRLQLGEDFLFCSRARKAGHQPHVDLGCVCAHIGAEIFLNHNTLTA